MPPCFRDSDSSVRGVEGEPKLFVPKTDGADLSVSSAEGLRPASAQLSTGSDLQMRSNLPFCVVFPEAQNF